MAGFLSSSAIERLGQRARQFFQIVRLVPGEEVRVRQAPTLEGALQQLHGLLRFWKISERHRSLN
jgi:hypothetical protein